MVGTSNQSDPENPSDMKPHQTLADDMPSVGDCRQEGKSSSQRRQFSKRRGVFGLEWISFSGAESPDSDVSSIHLAIFIGAVQLHPQGSPGKFLFGVPHFFGGHQHHPNLVKLKGGNRWFWALGSHNFVTYLYFIVPFRGFLSSKSPQTISSSNRWFQDALVCLNMAYTTTVYPNLLVIG